MNPAVIVVVNFMGQNRLALADIGDVVAYAGADKVVLEPSIGALDFSLGLR